MSDLEAARAEVRHWQEAFREVMLSRDQYERWAGHLETACRALGELVRQQLEAGRMSPDQLGVVIAYAAMRAADEERERIAVGAREVLADLAGKKEMLQ